MKALKHAVAACRVYIFIYLLLFCLMVCLYCIYFYKEIRVNLCCRIYLNVVPVVSLALSAAALNVLGSVIKATTASTYWSCSLALYGWLCFSSSQAVCLLVNKKDATYCLVQAFAVTIVNNWLILIFSAYKIYGFIEKAYLVLVLLVPDSGVD